jgi:4-hydroxy-2-oxoheptanedioate aldolase
MRENGLYKVWREKRVAVNAWLALGSPYAAEIVANLPYDSVTVDLQHGMYDFETALTMFQAISTSTAVPMVRISANEPWMAQKVLDAGAYGVICPMISTVEDCRRFVSSCRYPPLGERSFGPARGLLYGGSDYPKHANEHVLTWGMIETAIGLGNVAAILEVRGLDGIYIGPSDLALSLGCPISSDVHADVRAAIGVVLKAVRAAGKRAGIFCSTLAFGREMAALGFDLITVSTDAEMLRGTARTLLEDARAAAGARHG